MKYAVISDIHGNAIALSAVLKDAEEQGADAAIFVGDYAISLPFPNEIAEILRGMGNTHIVRGNEESYLRALERQDPSSWKDAQLQAVYWCYNTLTAENRRYLTSLPKLLRFSDGGTPITVTHSSEDLLGDVERAEFSSAKTATRYLNRPFTHERLLRDIRTYLDGSPAFHEKRGALSDGVYIFGHTHVQWHAQFGNTFFINPGSCGLALDCADAGAPYVLLTVASGKIAVDERRVPYDVELTIRALHSSELGRQAAVWSKITESQLRTCREHAHFFLKHAEHYATKIGDTVRPFRAATWNGAYADWTA